MIRRETANKRGKAGDDLLARFGISPSTSNTAPLLVKEANKKPIVDDSHPVDEDYVWHDNSQPMDEAYVLEDDSQAFDDDELLLLYHESQEFCATG